MSSCLERAARCCVAARAPALRSRRLRAPALTPASAAPRRRRKSPPGTSTCAPTSRACRRARARRPRARRSGRRKCASCHGVFGESQRGLHAARRRHHGGRRRRPAASPALRDAAIRARTTLMKVATVSTLWDYIHRAMPWTQPKSLTATRCMPSRRTCSTSAASCRRRLHASDKNIAEAQQRLPNRNGMTTRHALWPGRELGGTAKPDVQRLGVHERLRRRAEGRLRRCPSPRATRTATWRSRTALVGAQHGIDTAPAAAATPPVRRAQPRLAAPRRRPPPPAATALLNQHGCVACHGVDNKIVGPALREVATEVRRPRRCRGLSRRKDPLRRFRRLGRRCRCRRRRSARTDAQRIAGWLAGGAAGP